MWIGVKMGFTGGALEKWMLNNQQLLCKLESLLETSSVTSQSHFGPQHRTM
jgi:hypothetical protein